jgi:hypothetical protein
MLRRFRRDFCGENSEKRKYWEALRALANIFLEAYRQYNMKHCGWYSTWTANRWAISSRR